MRKQRMITSINSSFLLTEPTFVMNGATLEAAIAHLEVVVFDSKVELHAMPIDCNRANHIATYHRTVHADCWVCTQWQLQPIVELRCAQQ